MPVTICTVAAFYRYAVENKLVEHSPGDLARRPRLDHESHVTSVYRHEFSAQFGGASTRTSSLGITEEKIADRD